MAVAFLQRLRPSVRKQRQSRQSDTLTLADIDADTGKGPAADLTDCTFHESTEDFIAALRSQRNGAPPQPS